MRDFSRALVVAVDIGCSPFNGSKMEFVGIEAACPHPPAGTFSR
jgi:hypothetical protein